MKPRRRLTSWHVTVALAVLLAAGIEVARGEPPEGADGSLAPFYRGLTQPGTGALCYSVSDCRTVVTRVQGGHVWAFIDGSFPNSPNTWVEVPPEVIIRGIANPTGEPVACWFGGRVRCFVDGGAV